MPQPNEQREPIQWMDVDELENELKFEESTELTDVFRRVREEVAEDIIRHRTEEAADFADAQHQMVGYEITR